MKSEEEKRPKNIQNAVNGEDFVDEFVVGADEVEGEND